MFGELAAVYLQIICRLAICLSSNLQNQTEIFEIFLEALYKYHAHKMQFHG
jgi:hypothetical protein